MTRVTKTTHLLTKLRAKHTLCGMPITDRTSWVLLEMADSIRHVCWMCVAFKVKEGK